MKEDDFSDIYGLNYKNLNKEEALSLYENFIKRVHPMHRYDVCLEPVTLNNGERAYIWHPCMTRTFVLTKEEYWRLYPDYDTPADRTD